MSPINPKPGLAALIRNYTTSLHLLAFPDMLSLS